MVLEAFGYELEPELKKRNYQIASDRNLASKNAAEGTIAFVYRSSSQTVMLLTKFNEADAKALKKAIWEILRGAYKQGPQAPPLVDPTVHEKQSGGQSHTSEFYLQPPSEHMTFVVDLVRVGKMSLRAAVNKALMMNRRQQMRVPNLPVSVPAQGIGSGFSDREILQCPIDPAQQIDTTFDLSEAVEVDEIPGLLVSQNSSHIVNKERFPAALTIAGEKIYDEDLPSSLKVVALSKRSADLAIYGRDARRTVYKATMESADFDALTTLRLFDQSDGENQNQAFDFARSFQDLVEGAPSHMPIGLRNKLAYFYVDGNGFGKKRELCNLTAYSRFSRMARSNFVRQLLTHIISKANSTDHDAWVLANKRIPIRKSLKRKDVTWENRHLLRIETLLNAGDEFCVVLPAWHAFDLMPRMMDWLEKATDHAVTQLKSIASKDWGWNEGKQREKFNDLFEPFTYRAGMVICDAKTPARKAMALAHVLCDDAKIRRPKDTWALSFHISEGFDVPDLNGTDEQALSKLRGLRFKNSGDQINSPKDICRAFRLNGSNYAKAMRSVQILKEHLAKTKVHQIIAVLDASENVDETGMKNELLSVMDMLEFRSSSGISIADVLEQLPGDTDVPWNLRFKILAELWDYVDPLGQRFEEGNSA